MQGTTALVYACTQDRPEVVHLLLSRGADVATVSNEVHITAVITDGVCVLLVKYIWHCAYRTDIRGVHHNLHSTTQRTGPFCCALHVSADDAACNRAFTLLLTLSIVVVVQHMVMLLTLCTCM